RELGAVVRVRRSAAEVLRRSGGAPVGIPWRGAGALAAEYVGLRAAASLLIGEAPAPEAEAGLREGTDRSSARPVACRDGWVIARWRTPQDRRLLWAVAGPMGRASRSTL